MIQVDIDGDTSDDNDSSTRDESVCQEKSSGSFDVGSGSGGAAAPERQSNHTTPLSSRSSRPKWIPGSTISALRQTNSLGITFATRASVAAGATDARSVCRASSSDLYRNHWRATKKIFPEPSAGDGSRMRGPCSAWRPRAARLIGLPLLARHLARALRASGAVSCIYVLWAVAVDPACASCNEDTGTFQTVEGWLALLHLVNALLYALLALPSWLLPGGADAPGAEELRLPKETAPSHLRSPGIYLDLLALGGLAAELAHAFRQPHAGAAAGVPSGAQWAMLLQLGKGWRTVLHGEPLSAERNSFLQGVARLFLSLAFFAHVMASLLLILGAHEVHWGGESWIDAVASLDGGCPVLYTEALYYAVLSLTSVGYGDVLVTPLERAVNSFFLILSQLFTAKVCADLTWLTSTHNYWEAQHEARRTQTWVALRRMQVPAVLRKRVLAFQHYTATVHREDVAQPAFAGLSGNLIQELRLCAYHKLVLKAPFLREQTKEVISLIVNHLHDTVFLPADFIVRAGEVGRELHFVRRGECAVFVGRKPPCWGENEEVSTYSSGDYFGELGMLTGNPRSAWIMAKTYCVCSVLPYSAVELLSAEFPCAFTTVVRSMVSTFQMKSCLDWAAVSARISEKQHFHCVEDAFQWFCEQDNADDDELSARAFERAMVRLKVRELDRKILWAEIDVENKGFVSLSEFSAKIVIRKLPPARPAAAWRRRGRAHTTSTTLSSNAASPSLEGIQHADLFAECQRRMAEMGMVLSVTVAAPACTSASAPASSQPCSGADAGQP